MKRLALTVAVAFASAGAASAATLVNGSFEDPGTYTGNFATISPGTDIPGWLVESGSVDLVRNYWQPSDGLYSIDMSGSGPGVLSQVITDLIIGTRYRVSFDMAGNPDGQPVDKLLAVSAGVTSQEYSFDTILGSGTRQNMNWASYTFDFVAGGTSETLRFSSLVDTAYGAALDNVSISAVPLPAAGLMLIGALGALGLAKRRRG